MKQLLTTHTGNTATGKLLLDTGVVVCLFLSAAMGQTGVNSNSSGNSTPTQANLPTTKPKPLPGPKPITFGSVTFSGSLRARTENWSWFDTSAADPDYNFGGLLLRLSLAQQKTKFDWQVEVALPLLINVPTNSIAPAPQGQLGLGASYFAASGNQDGSVNLKQAFLRFKGLGGDKPSSLRFGRFEFVDGAETTPDDPTLATLKRDHIAHRLIGPFTFSHVGRSFDSVHYARNTRTTNFTVIGARPQFPMWFQS